MDRSERYRVDVVERGEAEGLENVLWTCRSEIQGGASLGTSQSKPDQPLTGRKRYKIGFGSKEHKFRGIIEKRSQKGKFGVSFFVLNTQKYDGGGRSLRHLFS